MRTRKLNLDWSRQLQEIEEKLLPKSARASARRTPVEEVRQSRSNVFLSGTNAHPVEPTDEQLRMIANTSSLQSLHELRISRGITLPVSSYLARVPMLGRLSGLLKLDLSYNMIETLEIPEKMASLRHLVVSHNRIAEVSTLASLPVLEVLDLSHNQVREIAHDIGATSLQVLDLSHNVVSALACIAGLKTLPMLFALDLRDNPVSVSPSYSSAVVIRDFPGVQVVDMSQPLSATKTSSKTSSTGKEESPPLQLKESVQLNQRALGLLIQNKEATRRLEAEKEKILEENRALREELQKRKPLMVGEGSVTEAEIEAEISCLSRELQRQDAVPRSTSTVRVLTSPSELMVQEENGEKSELYVTADEISVEKSEAGTSKAAAGWMKAVVESIGFRDELQGRVVAAQAVLKEAVTQLNARKKQTDRVSAETRQRIELLSEKGRRILDRATEIISGLKPQLRPSEVPNCILGLERAKLALALQRTPTGVQQQIMKKEVDEVRLRR